MSSMMNLCCIRESDEIELTRDIIRETRLEFDNEGDTDIWGLFFNDKEDKELNEEEQVDLAFVKLKRMLLVLCHTEYSICSSEHNTSFLIRLLFNKDLILTSNDSLYAKEESMERNKYWIDICGGSGSDILLNVYKGVNNG